MIVCDQCGATNEPKLTFCRTCGDRLPKSKAAPAEEPRTIRGPVDADDLAVGRAARPSAPPLMLSRTKSGVGDGPAASPVPEDSASPSAADEVRCEQCGVESPKDYRFCVGCGAVLPRTRDIVPAVLAHAMNRARRASLRPQAPAIEPRIEARASRVPSEPARPAERAGAPSRSGVDCAACGNHCQADETFCKHCGARLSAEPGGGKTSGEVGKTSGEVGKTSGEVRIEAARAAAPAQEARPRAEGKKARAREATEVTGRLVVIVEDGSEGTAIDLRGRQMDIGSAEGDIVLEEDRYLSPRHARLFRQDDHWYLRDLDSLNGVYRRLRKPAALRDGDTILLGLEVLRFERVQHGERGLGHAMEHGVLLFGSPATPRRARLSQRTVEGVTRDVHHLVGEETTIGRETGDIVFTSDPFMSRRHAMIAWNEATEEFVLTDLSSSNGTYLAIRDDVRLENGDFVRLGQHLFRVDLTPSGAGNR